MYTYFLDITLTLFRNVRIKKSGRGVKLYKRCSKFLLSFTNLVKDFLLILESKLNKFTSREMFKITTAKKQEYEPKT